MDVQARILTKSLVFLFMEKQCLITENQFFYLLNNKAIEEIKNHLSDNEICLKEERGVGAAPYRKQINNICNYAAVYVYENKKPNIDLKFEVPLSLTKPISMFSELHIECTVTDDINARLGGSAPVSVFPFITKKYGMYDTPQTIRIISYANNNVLDKRTFIGTLYHELNHKIDALYHKFNSNKEANPNGFTDVSRQGFALKNLNKIKFPDEVCDMFFKKIVYRLFSNSEMNALAASVYGDLLAIDSHPENYQNDIKQTEAYKEYFYIKDNFEVLNVLPLEDYKILQKTLVSTILYPSGLTDKDNVNVFKRRFITIVGQRLNKLLHMIGKVASFYYDSKRQNDEWKTIINEEIYI